MTTPPRDSLHALFHDAERMARLYAAVSGLADAPTLDALAKRIVHAARSLSRADCANLTLLDRPHGSGHVVWSGFGCDRGEVVLERELRAGGRPFGVLRLRTMGADVAREDEALVDLLCLHASVAIETVQLRRQDELVRRMRALVGTPDPAPAVGAGSIRAVGDIRIDLVRHAAFVGDTRVHLTPSEFRLLELLSEEPGRAYSRDEIVERLWGGLDPGSSRVADVHVARLRRKLARGAPGPGRLESVRGVGYRLTSAAADACPTCAPIASAPAGTDAPSPA